MLKAIEYEILRAVKASGTIKIDMPRKPVRVATLLNEEKFDVDHLLIHNDTVFLEDYVHDWNWREGKFTYYTRIATEADVVVVFELGKN